MSDYITDVCISGKIKGKCQSVSGTLDPTARTMT